MTEEHVFTRKWKKQMRQLLSVNYPNASKKDINAYLDEVIEKNLKNPSCYIDNNYIHKRLNTNLLDLIDWIDTTKPICAGHGVFFRNQNEIKNPLANMIRKFLSLRKQFKDLLKVYKEGTYEYQTSDRKQGSEKTNTNSIYGCYGQTKSFLFNKYTAPAVTGSGQALISTTENAFEAFMANNVAFNNINECMVFLNNVIHEPCDLSTDILDDILLEDVESRLVSMFYKYKPSYLKIIHEYLINVSQEDLNRIYYKNNLYEFSDLPVIHDILTKIIKECDEFKDPNKIPESIASYLESLWSYYSVFVFYNHSPIDRIQRLKNDKRKCVITIDTDSNMLNLNPWVEYIHDNILDNDDLKRDPMNIRFISINIMAYVITQMIREVLNDYSEHVNIPKEYRSYLNMKNEFLFTRMILSAKKKRYISSVRLREGKEIYPEKIDPKGFDFMKSTTTESTKERYLDMITRRLLHTDEIDFGKLFADVLEFENELKTSLSSGDKTYLTPISVNELESYADPFKMQGVRAIHAWNSIYPNMSIELPAKIDMVKLKLDDAANLESLKASYPEIYESVLKHIVNNPNEKIAKKGLIILAIPKNVKNVPEWVLPYIDYDTMIFDVLKKFYPILTSLGFTTLKSSKKEYFTNIIDI